MQNKIKLESTPYVKIRKANGLLNIDYTACDIFSIENIAIARSYNTFIGIYAAGPDGKKYYFKNSNSYSSTTATKHHPRAQEIAIYNGYNTVVEVRPETLYKIYNATPETRPELLKQILYESQIKDEIKTAINNNEYIYKNINVFDYIKLVTRKHTPYKNTNFKDVYLYQTNFKYISNINIKYTQHAFNTVKPSTGYRYKYTERWSVIYS